MKFSMAIRLGAMLRPQGFGDLWTAKVSEAQPTVIESCALGAAFDALGCGCDDPWRGNPPIAIAVWLLQPATCPLCPNLPGQRQGLIVHLNDNHRWTREQIADWVQEQEQKDEAEVCARRQVGVSGG